MRKAKNSGATPLFQAVLFGHEKCVELLLRASAAVDQATNEGDTPLSIALWTMKYDEQVRHAAFGTAFGHEKCAALLRAAGAKDVR